MSTPDKRVEEIVQHVLAMKDKFLEEKKWIEYVVNTSHQDRMSEVVEKIEKAKYPKDSTQGCNCNGYNNALTEAQTIIKLSK